MGKVRHLKIQALWVQEVRSTGRLSYKKALGTLNPSDILTKHVPGDLLDAHLKALGMEIRGGRADAAPSLDELGIEYVTDWVETIPKKTVSFVNTVSVRPIPAIGHGRPTRQCRKTRRAWADEDDDDNDNERDVHSLVDWNDGDSEDNDQCKWEIYGQKKGGPEHQFISEFETSNDYVGDGIKEDMRLREDERNPKYKKGNAGRSNQVVKKLKKDHGDVEKKIRKIKYGKADPVKTARIIKSNTLNILIVKKCVIVRKGWECAHSRALRSDGLGRRMRISSGRGSRSHGL